MPARRDGGGGVSPAGDGAGDDDAPDGAPSAGVVGSARPRCPRIPRRCRRRAGAGGIVTAALAVPSVTTVPAASPAWSCRSVRRRPVIASAVTAPLRVVRLRREHVERAPVVQRQCLSGAGWTCRPSTTRPWMSPPVRSCTVPSAFAASEADVHSLRTRTAPSSRRTCRTRALAAALGAAPWCLAAVAIAQPAWIASDSWYGPSCGGRAERHHEIRCPAGPLPARARRSPPRTRARAARPRRAPIQPSRTPPRPLPLRRVPSHTRPHNRTVRTSDAVLAPHDATFRGPRRRLRLIAHMPITRARRLTGHGIASRRSHRAGTRPGGAATGPTSAAMIASRAETAHRSSARSGWWRCGLTTHATWGGQCAPDDVICHVTMPAIRHATAAAPISGGTSHTREPVTSRTVPPRPRPVGGPGRSILAVRRRCGPGRPGGPRSGPRAPAGRTGSPGPAGSRGGSGTRAAPRSRCPPRGTGGRGRGPVDHGLDQDRAPRSPGTSAMKLRSILSVFTCSWFRPPERRVAGAEVVDRQAQAARVQLGQHRLEVGDRRHRRLLGDLHHHPVGVQAERVDRGHHLAHRRRLPERRRQVDRDEQVVAAVAPLAALAAGLVDDPVGDRADQPGALGDRQELGRGEQSALGIVPADQRLGADDAAVAQARPGAGSAARARRARRRAAGGRRG